MKTLLVSLSYLLALSLTACGGGGDSPISAAQAQAIPPAPVEVARFDFVLRPDDSGHWFIQDDVDHAARGVLPQVMQCPGADGCQPGDAFVRVSFDRRYTHAGVVQITSDDDFGKHGIEGHGNLGVTSTTILITRAGVGQIDPASVYQYTPVGAGNLWVSVTMVNKP